MIFNRNFLRNILRSFDISENLTNFPLISPFKQERGSNIFGIGDRSDLDFKPYLKLTFANGPAYYKHHSNSTNQRTDPLTLPDLTNMEFESPMVVPRKSETHGADDVVVYAIGPYSHLFTGSIEENVIPHMMAYAACIGTGATACSRGSGSPGGSRSTGGSSVL